MITTINRIVASIFVLLVSVQSLQAREVQADPLNSVMWNNMVERFMPDGDVIFDPRVKVIAPVSAEDQFYVPITVDATELENVDRVIAVADLNPIPLVLTVTPHQALSFIGFRLKLQQSSPIHVGVRTTDGVWHVGGVLVDAAGGGCTAPAAAHMNSNWMKTLGETRAFAGRDLSGSARMTLRMRHPMDTGLAAGIPAFYLNELSVETEDGVPIADLELFEPVSENPTLTIKPDVGDEATTITVSGRDTEGNNYRFPLSLPAVAAAAASRTN